MAQMDHPNGFFTKSTIPTVGLRPLHADNGLGAANGVQSASGSHHPDALSIKHYLSNILTALLLAISIFGCYQIASLVWPEQQRPVTATTSPATAAAPVVKPATGLARSAPTTVTIDAIGVNAPVVAVGLDSNGSVEVPGPNDVGWYHLGPTPGEVGPAVMVGHVDDAVIGPAVFWNLRNMQPGQTIQIAREDGKSVNFTVEKVATYDQNNFATDEVYGNIDYAGLRLITCEGDFDYVTGHYSDNLVVYARADL